MPLSHTCKQAYTIYKLYKGLDWKSFKLAKVYTFYHIVGSTNPLHLCALMHSILLVKGRELPLDGLKDLGNPGEG
jgi:hypothetical protein